MVETQRTVLIIEDDVDNADTLVVRFTVHGFLTLYARSRDEALKLLLTHGEPDCVLMDWYMPGMSVPDFLERARKLHPEMSFVTMSSAETTREIAAQFGITTFILKPLDLDLLIETLERCIALRRRKQN